MSKHVPRPRIAKSKPMYSASLLGIESSCSEDENYFPDYEQVNSNDSESDKGEKVSEWETPSTSECSGLSDVDCNLEVVDDSPIPDCEGIGRDDWKGHTVEAHYDHGSKFARVLVSAVNPLMSVDGEENLGDHNFGVVVYEIFDGDRTLKDTCISWPTHLLFHDDVSVYDHLRRHATIMQDEKLLQSKKEKKRKYDNSNRPSREKRTQEWRIGDDQIRDVYMQECNCSRHCTRIFPPDVVRNLRCDMFFSGPEHRRAKNLDVHKTTFKSADGKEDLVMLEFKEVCLNGWKLIHGVSGRSFRRYSKQSKNGERGRPHGNLGKKKPRASTQQAEQTLGSLIDDLADKMPYSCTLPTGERVPQKVLPTGIRWNQFLSTINKVNIQVGLKPVSATLLSKIRITKYADYMIKRRGDSFSRCSKCDTYTTLRDSATRNSEEQKKWAMKFSNHTRAQFAARNVYWSDKQHSVDRPLEFLSIFHDAMDHSKTALPSLKSRTKNLDALMKLPVSVVGMYAHGYGDGRYAHYSLDVFFHDSNFTIGSIAKLLRDLEEPPMKSSRALFSENESTPLYKAVLQGKEICLPSLGEPPANLCTASVLPPVIHVQLDNCWRENKNRYAFCFWSLLVAKKIVQEVVVSFMMVGHTHDDIDASFGRWSMVLKERNYPTLPMLMKSYMDLDKDGVMIPHLIEEVPDFKKFVDPYIEKSANKKLQGHSQGNQFRFFLHEDGWPLMQYKLACTEKRWKPTHAPGIRLWKEDEQGKPLLPPEDAEPVALKPKNFKHEAELLKGIHGYIEYYNSLSKADMTPTFKAQHSYYVEYWRGVYDGIASMSIMNEGNACHSMNVDDILVSNDGNDILGRTSTENYLSTNNDSREPNDAHRTISASDVENVEETVNGTGNGDITLKFGFWPRTRLSSINGALPIINTNRSSHLQVPVHDSDAENEAEPYIGARVARPPPPFIPSNDIRKGFFVFVRPSEGSMEPIWLGKVVEHPQMDPALSNYKTMKVRWWIPTNAAKDIAEAYNGWSTIPGFSYRLDRSAKIIDQISTDCVLSSWKPEKGRIQCAPPLQIQCAPPLQIQFALDNIRRIAEYKNWTRSMHLEGMILG